MVQNVGSQPLVWVLRPGTHELTQALAQYGDHGGVQIVPHLRLAATCITRPVMHINKFSARTLTPPRS